MLASPIGESNRSLIALMRQSESVSSTEVPLRTRLPYSSRSRRRCDESKTDGEENYVWAAVDCDKFEVIAVEISPGRSNLDALLFLKEILKWCNGRPPLRAGRGPWYDWLLERFDYEYERETRGNRSLIETWFGILNIETDASTTGFHSIVPPNQQARGLHPSLLSTQKRIIIIFSLYIQPLVYELFWDTLA